MPSGRKVAVKTAQARCFRLIKDMKQLAVFWDALKAKDVRAWVCTAAAATAGVGILTYYAAKRYIEIYVPIQVSAFFTFGA